MFLKLIRIGQTHPLFSPSLSTVSSVGECSIKCESHLLNHLGIGHVSSLQDRVSCFWQKGLVRNIAISYIYRPLCKRYVYMLNITDLILSKQKIAPKFFTFFLNQKIHIELRRINESPRSIGPSHFRRCDDATGRVRGRSWNWRRMSWNICHVPDDLRWDGLTGNDLKEWVERRKSRMFYFFFWGGWWGGNAVLCDACFVDD